MFLTCSIPPPLQCTVGGGSPIALSALWPFIFTNVDFLYFCKLGWSLNDIKAQAKKRSNYSIELMKFNILNGFIIGDLIYIEKISEYEILLIYAKNICRKF